MEYKNKKNKESDFFNTNAFLKLNKENFLWEGDFQQLVVILNAIPFCDNTHELMSLILFWDSNLPDFEMMSDKLEKNQIETFFARLINCSYDPFVISIIFNYLKFEYQQKNMFLNYGQWEKIVPILIKPKVTDAVFAFLIEMQIPDLLIKTKSEEEFLTAIRLSFNSTIFYQYDSWNLKGVENFLKFLKIEKKVRVTLIEKTFTQKIFEDIIRFLNTYKLTL